MFENLTLNFHFHFQPNWKIHIVGHTCVYWLAVNLVDVDDWSWRMASHELLKEKSGGGDSR